MFIYNFVQRKNRTFYLEPKLLIVAYVYLLNCLTMGGDLPGPAVVKGPEPTILHLYLNYITHHILTNVHLLLKNVKSNFLHSFLLKYMNLETDLRMHLFITKIIQKNQVKITSESIRVL